MENTQGTLQYIAGLFEGEGSVSLSPIRARTRKGKEMEQIRSAVYITNTDTKLISAVRDFLKQNNWSYFIRTDIRPGRRVCYNLQLTKQSDRLAFLETILPHLIGEKKELAKVVITYLKYRIELSKKWQAERGGEGQYKTGVGSSYTEVEPKLYQQYKSLKNSSETKCKIPVTFG